MSNPNPTSAELTDSNNMTLTDSAATKISELIKEEDNPKLNLRVFISGGGCSGFQYGFVFDETINEDDICVKKKVRQNKADKTTEEDNIRAKKKGRRNKADKIAENDDEGGAGTGSEVKLIVDPMSFQYLIGAEIDYKSDIKGEQFIIRNPMAKTTCGCGSSFSA